MNVATEPFSIHIFKLCVVTHVTRFISIKSNHFGDPAGGRNVLINEGKKDVTVLNAKQCKHAYALVI